MEATTAELGEYKEPIAKKKAYQKASAEDDDALDLVPGPRSKCRAWMRRNQPSKEKILALGVNFVLVGVIAGPLLSMPTVIVVSWYTYAVSYSQSPLAPGAATTFWGIFAGIYAAQTVATRPFRPILGVALAPVLEKAVERLRPRLPFGSSHGNRVLALVLLTLIIGVGGACAILALGIPTVSAIAGVSVFPGPAPPPPPMAMWPPSAPPFPIERPLGLCAGTLIFAACIEIFKGICHTWLVRFSCENIMRAFPIMPPNPKAESQFMFVTGGIGGVGNFHTAFSYLLISQYARELAPYILVGFPMLMVFGMMGMFMPWNRVDRHAAQFNGRRMMAGNLCVCLTTGTLFFYSPEVLDASFNYYAPAMAVFFTAAFAHGILRGKQDKAPIGSGEEEAQLSVAAQ